MPCIEWLTQHEDVYFFGYQPTFHPEAPFIDWCGVPVVLHLHVSKTQSYPTNAANEIFKSWDWVEGSVVVTEGDTTVFQPPPPVEPEGDIFVPLPPFPLDLEVPAPIYGGINCGTEAGPPGPQGPPGDVNIETMIGAVESTDDTGRTNFNLAVGTVSIYTPENFCAAIQIAAPSTVQCVAQILRDESTILLDSAETRVVPGAPVSLTVEIGPNGESHHVLTVPSEGGGDVKLIPYQQDLLRCDNDGVPYIETTTQYAVGVDDPDHPGQHFSTEGFQTEVQSMLRHLFSCCPICSYPDPYIDWDIDQPAWFAVTELDRVEIQLITSEKQLITQMGNPPVMKLAKFTWLVDEDYKATDELFVNYDKQVFPPPTSVRVTGFAVIPQSGTAVKVRLFGIPPANLETTSPHLEPLRP